MSENTSSHTDRVLSDLVSDIARAQTMITYYENVILRKEIAVQEIINGQQARKITTEEINAETITNKYL